jgi:predicted TIM-barrel fold metal-dependent hydrolase
MSVATKSASTPTTTSIACLESYLNPSLPISSLPTSDPSAPALHILPAPTISKLRNLGPARVKDMRVLGHSKQILSHIPIAASVGSCTRFNDALGAAIQMTADKFAALAMLPADGKDAGRELQRCVTKMRFVGGVLGLGQGNGMLDPAYKDLWTAAEKYRVPIVLRDTWPVGSEVRSLS